MLIDLSNFKFPSAFSYKYYAGGRQCSQEYFPRLGDVDSSFGMLLSPEKIVKIPSNYTTYINNVLGGSLANAFKNCSNLEIDCELLADIIPSSLAYTFYNCKSVKNIDKLNLSLISNSNLLTSTFYNAKLDEIPKNFLDKMQSLVTAKPFINRKIKYIDELKMTNSLSSSANTISLINKLYIPLGSEDLSYCGTIDSINYIEISRNSSEVIGAYNTIINKIGVINSTNYRPLEFNSKSFPKSVDAFPYYNKSTIYSIPTSTGYEYWADYIEVNTNACKNITERSIVLSEHISTLDNKLSDFNIRIPYSKILKAVTDYNHTFEIESIKTMRTTESIINVENAKYKSVSNDTENKDVIITVDFTDIQDDSISTININKLYLEYTAKIDGYQFTGRTLVNVDIKYDFTLDENIDMSIAIVEDEQ